MDIDDSDAVLALDVRLNPQSSPNCRRRGGRRSARGRREWAAERHVRRVTGWLVDVDEGA